MGRERLTSHGVVLLRLEDFTLRERLAGFQVGYLPISDFGVPARADLEQAIPHTLAHAQAAWHIVVHCAAGLGHTGLFLASLAKRALGLSGAEAIQWVRQQRLLLHDEEA